MPSFSVFGTFVELYNPWLPLNLVKFVALIFLDGLKETVPNISVFCLGNGVVCYCDGQCPDNQPNGTCTTPEGGTCFSAVEGIYNPDTGLLEPEYTFGCLSGDEGGLMQCRSSLSHPRGKAILCCDYMDLCNRVLKPPLETRTSTPPPGLSYDDSIHYIALIISVTVCLVAFLVIVAYYYLRYKKREDMRLLSLSQASRY